MKRTRPPHLLRITLTSAVESSHSQCSQSQHPVYKSSAYSVKKALIRLVRLNRQIVFRICLVPVAVAICYLFQWKFLRSLTADLNLQFTSMFGIHWVRLASDVAMFHGQQYRYAIACTMADAWCGAIPLVWNVGGRAWKNLAYLAGLAVLMFGFNTIRLAVSSLMMSYGVSRLFGHDSLSAVAYLMVWLLIQRRAAWNGGGGI
jgi:hypothetical protein